MGPCKRQRSLYRHNEILDALIAAAKMVGISATRDNILAYMRSSPEDQEKKQPDGAFKLFHRSHRTTLADVVCTHPTTASAMKSIYRSVGCFANKSESGKVGKYEQDAARHGFKLQLAGCETFGAPGEGVVQLVNDIATHAAVEGRSDTRAAVG